MPVPLNCKESYDCLIISLLIRLRMQNMYFLFQRDSAFLILHIGVKEMIHIKTIVEQSKAQ